MIRLFTGLGNPGPEYEATRHNAGFWWLEALSRQLGVKLALEKGFFGLVGKTQIDGKPAWLLCPQTYMNLSGQSVAGLANFYKIAPDEILVVHDELDIVPGEAKLKFGGGHGGHNGLRDIHARLGSDQYWRLRLGIGHPGVKTEVLQWVLKKPSADHRKAIEQAIERSLKAVPALAQGDTHAATRQIHSSKPPRPKPPRAPIAASEPGSHHASDQNEVPVPASDSKP